MILLIIILYYKKIEKFTVDRPSKCFSCEREIINRVGITNVWRALPTKCFDCEKQALNNNENPYHTGPTKCFDCDMFKNNGVCQKI